MPYSKGTVKDAPHIDPDERLLSQSEEADLYSYYGLGYSNRRSATGLPEGRDTGRSSSDASARLVRYDRTEHQNLTVPIQREQTS